MPTIKLFESWLSDQTGQVNEAEPTAKPIITAEELAAEAKGKKLNMPFISPKKGVMVVPQATQDKNGVEFYIYPLDQTPGSILTAYRSSMGVATGKHLEGDVVPAELDAMATGTGTPKPAGYTVGTIVDVYGALNSATPSLTGEQFLTMLDASRPGYTADLAKAAASGKPLITIGNPEDPYNANKVALLNLAKTKSAPATPSAPGAPAATPSAKA